MVKGRINLPPEKLVFLAFLLLWLKTAIVSFIGFDFSIVSWLDVLLLMINPAGSLLLMLGLSFYFGRRLNRIILIVIMVLITGLLYADLLYYRFYIDFVTVSVFFQFKNVGGIGPSTFELVKAWDLLLLADIFLIAWLSRRWDMQRLVIPSIIRKRYIAAGIALVLLVAGLGLFQSSRLFSAAYNRSQMVKTIGPYNYHLYDIAMALRPPLDQALADKSDTAAISQYVSSHKQKHSGLFGIAKGKNIVLISMESTQNFVINRKVDGKEITPFLNKLVKKSYYFNSIYDQTAQGKTSDAEFMVDNSLYPLSGGSVFVRRPENTFNSLPKILKQHGNYYSAVFHGNDASFWNRENMYDHLGYNRFFSKKDFTVTEENSINYGIKDIPFFEQSIPYLKSLPQPYYAKMITLTNHFPFLLNEEDQMISAANTDEGVVNRYITTVRYEDEALRHFFQKLKKNGMYKNTIFVLYGDHYGISEKYEDALSTLLDEKDTPANHTKYRQVPLIIHIPGQEEKTISTLGGEVDIRPTLLDLLGIDDSRHISFGQNLFSRDPKHPVIFRNGGFAAGNLIYQDNICYNARSGEELESKSCEPYQDTVHKELDLSDEIIYGDLLRFK
ncbi:Phosphoglycerol transferase MdoB [Bacillus sp. OV322]|uniref:LTA synthase family protein n=1 Tax=Bacillus sp. OV322 TaxID=1882764 RepID=UPI0008EFB1E9|nr:LTA synthase family protein [Bacillus sp. OV322]SFC02119.1 Phosphoglycerol transferase MdoB [Bacillus sp. OV322]